MKSKKNMSFRFLSLFLTLCIILPIAPNVEIALATPQTQAASGFLELGITSEELDAMALDPQSWRLTFDTFYNRPDPEIHGEQFAVFNDSRPYWDDWESFVPHPVVNWVDINNGLAPGPVFPPGVTPRAMRGAIIMVEFPDRAMISSLPKGSEIMGNPRVDTGVYGLQGQERAEALQTFWRRFLNEPIPELNRGHHITGGWLEYSSGLWTLELEVFGPYMLPHFQFMYPSVGTFWTTGAVAIQNFGNFDFRGQFPKQTALAGHASRLAVADNVPFIDDETGLRRHDFIFFTIAGYCQSPTWQEFGMMMFESPYVDANGNGINRNENFGWGEHQTVRSVRRSIADVEVVRDPVSHVILEGVTGMDFTGYAHIQRIIDRITAPGFNMAEQWPNFFMLNVEELWRSFVQTIPAPNGQTFVQYRTAWQNAINPETGLTNEVTLRNQFLAEFPNTTFTNAQILSAIIQPLFLTQYAEARKFEQPAGDDAPVAFATLAAIEEEILMLMEEEEERYLATPEMMDFALSLITPAFVPFGDGPPAYSQLYLEWFALNDPATAFDRLLVLLNAAKAEAAASTINPYFQAAPSRYVPWTSWYGGCNVWSHASSLSLIHPRWAGQISFSAQGEGAGMAVYSHELGHIVGLPDTYNLKYNTITTRPAGGVWDLMDAGDKPGYYGCHARWDVPGLRGGNVGTSLMIRQMIASGFTDLTTQVNVPGIPHPNRNRLRPDPENSVDILHIDYNDFRSSPPIVAEVFGRNVPVNRGFSDAHGNLIEGFMGIIIQGAEFRDQTPGVLAPPIFGTTNVQRAGNNILGVDLNLTAAEQPLSSLPRNPHGHLIIDPDRWNWYIGGNATNISFAETGIQGLAGRQHGFSLEVIDRTGYDSKCPSHGVIIARIAHTNALRAGGIDHGAHLIIDAHPGSMDFVQYWEPDGRPYMMADCHRVGISAAAFRAGTHNNPFFYRQIRGRDGIVREDPFRRFLPDDPRPGHAGHTVNEWVDEYNNFHFYILEKHSHDGRYGTFISYEVAVRNTAPGAVQVGGELILEAIGAPTLATYGNFVAQRYAVTNTGNLTDIVRITLDGDLTEVIGLGATKDQNAVMLNNLYAVEPGQTVEFYVFIRQGTAGTAPWATADLLTVTASSETNPTKVDSLAGPVIPAAYVVYNGWNPAELQALLNNHYFVVLTTNGLGIFSELTIPAGTTLIIENPRFVVHGVLNVEGTLVNNGQVHNQYYGTINVRPTGRIENNGFFQNNTRGVINIYSPGEIVGNPINGNGQINIIAEDTMGIAAALAAETAEAFFIANRPNNVTRANVTAMGNGILNAVNNALAAEGFTDITADWIAPFAGEAATTWDPSIMAGTLRLVQGSASNPAARQFIPLFWEVQTLATLNIPEWYTNRSVVPRITEGPDQGLFAPRNQFERDIFEAITVAGPKMWGTPNEQYVSRYLFDRFSEIAAVANNNLPATGRQASAHLVAIPLNHTNPSEPPNINFTGVSNHAPSGDDVYPHGAFNRHENTSAARISFIDGPGQYVFNNVRHGQRLNDWYGLWYPLHNTPGLVNSLSFQGANAATLVDLGTFPNLNPIPVGTTGDIAVTIRFGTAHLEMEQQLLPVIERLNESSDFEIRLVILARHRAMENPREMIPEVQWFNMGRRLWSGNVVQLNNRPQDKPGNTDNELAFGMYNALPGHEEFAKHFPFVLVSHAHLTNAEERASAGLLCTIERYERTHMYSPLLILPATYNPEEPELVLFIASHMDTVAHSHGIGDSTGGGLNMLQAARQIAGIDRGRTEIWVLPYSGHEEGMNAGTEVYSRGGSASFVSMVLDSQVRRMMSKTTASGISYADIAIVYSFDMINSLDGPRTGTAFRNAIGINSGVRPTWASNLIGPYATPINPQRNLAGAIFLHGARTMDDPGLWRRSNGESFGRTNITAAGGAGEATAISRDLGTMGGGMSNGTGLFYHNAWDHLDYDYDYYRMVHTSEMIRRGLLWAIEEGASRVAQLEVDRENRTLTLVNAERLFNVYDRVEGHLLVGTYDAIPFVFERAVGNVVIIPEELSIRANTLISVSDMVAFGSTPTTVAFNPDTNAFTFGAVDRFYARLTSNLAPTSDHLLDRLSGTRIYTGMIGRSGSYRVNNPFVRVGGVGYISNRVFANLIGGEQSFFTSTMNPMNNFGEVIVRGQHADGDLVTIRVPGWRVRNATWAQATHFGWWTEDTPLPLIAFVTKGDNAEQPILINTETTGVHVQGTMAYLPIRFLAETFGFEIEADDDAYVLTVPNREPAPELTYTVYDEDWRESINIRFFLDGAPVAIPLENMVLVADGVEIENIRDFTINIADWETEKDTVFISKTKTAWKHLTFTVTLDGQTLFFEFINNMFEEPADQPVLTTTIFAEAWRESINIRFFLDGVLSELPLENIVLIADGVQVENIRDFTINIAGWQTSTNAIFISRTKTPWQNLTVVITAYGQELRYYYVNTM